MKATFINHHQQRSLVILSLSVAFGIAAFLTPDWNVKLLAGSEGLNATQNSMLSAISKDCSNSANDPHQEDSGFQARCSGLLGLAEWGQSELDSAVRQVSPEQTISYGTNATKTSTGQSNNANQTVMNRMSYVRSETPTIQTSGIQFTTMANPWTRIAMPALPISIRALPVRIRISSVIWEYGPMASSALVMWTPLSRSKRVMTTIIWA